MVFVHDDIVHVLLDKTVIIMVLCLILYTQILICKVCKVRSAKNMFTIVTIIINLKVTHTSHKKIFLTLN